jgi:hypothetical protein
MYTVKNGGDIHKGDLVAISNGNDFSVGIYFGQGRGGTFQYYYTSSAGQSKTYYEDRLKLHGAEKTGPFKLGNIWKAYVNTPRDTRIIKLNRSNITDQETIDNILESKEILKQFNIEVNY